MDPSPPFEWYELRNALYASDFAEAAALVDRIPALLGLRNRAGETLLHDLAIENAGPAVAWLHERGLDLDTKDHSGQPVLFSVAMLGYREMQDWLIAHGADAAATNELGETLADVLEEAAMIDRWMAADGLTMEQRIAAMHERLFGAGPAVSRSLVLLAPAGAVPSLGGVVADAPGLMLCDHDEIDALRGGAAAVSSLDLADQAPLVVTFGPADVFDGDGVILHAVAGTHEFRALRERIIGPGRRPGDKPRLVVVEPSRSRTQADVLAAMRALADGLVITFPAVQLVERTKDGPPIVLREFVLGGGASAS